MWLYIQKSFRVAACILTGWEVLKSTNEDIKNWKWVHLRFQHKIFGLKWENEGKTGAFAGCVCRFSISFGSVSLLLLLLPVLHVWLTQPVKSASCWRVFVQICVQQEISLSCVTLYLSLSLWSSWEDNSLSCRSQVWSLLKTGGGTFLWVASQWGGSVERPLTASSQDVAFR